MDAISAGNLATISDALTGRKEPSAGDPLSETEPITSDPPSLGSGITKGRTSRTASQVDFVTGYVDEHGIEPPGYKGGLEYENKGPGFLPSKPAGYYRYYDIYPY